MMKSKILHLVKVLIVVFAFSSCESKFYESSPATVKGDGRSLDDRIAQKAEVDINLSEIQRGLGKINNTFDFIKKIQSPSNHEEVYSPLDLVFDISKELKSKIPEYRDEKIVRHAQMKVAVEDIAEPCKYIEARLESSTVSIESEPGKVESGKRITYFIKTCDSLGKYQMLLIAEWKNQELEMKLNHETLGALFKTIAVDEIQKNSHCRIIQDTQALIVTFSCENMEIILNKNEHAQAKSLIYNKSGETEIELVAELYENKNKKAFLNIKKLSNGKTYRDIRKISE